MAMKHAPSGVSVVLSTPSEMFGGADRSIAPTEGPLDHVAFSVPDGDALQAWRIKLVDRPYMTKWETGVYTNLLPTGKARWFQFEMEPNSVITRPSAGLHMAGRGFCQITGIAWSGGGTIRRVEVSTNGGRAWKDARSCNTRCFPGRIPAFAFPGTGTAKKL